MIHLRIHPDLTVRPQSQPLQSRTLGSGQTEGHGGGRHQDVCEDGPVSCWQRGGALLQQVQYCPSDVSGDVTADVQQHRHMLVTEETTIPTKYLCT